MNITGIDFETYFDSHFSLKRLTIPQYVHDPRFWEHGIAIRWPDGRAEFRTDVAAALSELQAHFGRDLEKTTIVCHHAQFDLYILNHRHGIRPRYFIDTMLLAYHVHGRRERGEGESAELEALAKRYGLPEKGNLDFMCGIREPDPTQLADLTSYAKRDVEITAALAERLLPQITRPEIELPLLMHTVRLFTERGVAVDVESISSLEAEIRGQTQQFLLAAGATPEVVSKNKMFTALLESALARTGRKVPLKARKKGLIPATAKTDPEMQNLLEDDDPVVANLAKARIELKGEDQKLARLRTLRNIAEATGGVLPPYLVYYGAHTGRFAGGGQFNVQNLGRKGLGAKVRNLLIPRPGCAFVIGDLAQIEARITAWYAGQEDMLEAFRQNRDQYSEFAAARLGREVRKSCPDDPDALKARLDSDRQVGKQAVLGLGFGMGTLTFMNRLRAEPDAARLFDAGELDALKCRQIVRDYRRHYFMIPRFWAALEESMRAAIDGMDGKAGCVRFDCADQLVRVWLPSGRALRYPDARLEQTQRTIRYINDRGDEDEFTPEGDSIVYGNNTTLYGGKLCENVVQALARDILVEAVLRLEDRGYRVLFHVHDEVVVEVEQDRAEFALRAVEEELSKELGWSAGLPIACEVQAAAKYQK
ncbi:MAG TPA: DNA polymerase [Tepidisphaeraceae bacterium]|jgi:DNA polymerase|nr:DNA polymerase [Tepidisphaeraceae bacterium]